jgi:hypothetical protein
MTLADVEVMDDVEVVGPVRELEELTSAGVVEMVVDPAIGEGGRAEGRICHLLEWLEVNPSLLVKVVPVVEASVLMVVQL